MYTTNYTLNHTELKPEAYVTKGKNRLKQHGESVYLDDQDQFEIELFNPKNTSVLAKIKINGNYISSRGLVVKPGQRVHLDRYIDEAKKFLFSTYEVSGTNEQVKEAIQYNGLVEIEFYDEEIPRTVFGGSFGQPYNQNIFYYSSNPIIGGSPTYGGSGTPTVNWNTVTCSTANLANSTFTSSVGGDDVRIKTTKASLSKSIETGRVEKGDDSDTKLKNVNMDFSYFTSHKVTWRILPNSQKPVEVSQLRNYCTGCGTRVKKSNWKFCPSCGSEI